METALILLAFTAHASIGVANIGQAQSILNRCCAVGCVENGTISSFSRDFTASQASVSGTIAKNAMRAT